MLLRPHSIDVTRRRRKVFIVLILFAICLIAFVRVKVDDVAFLLPRQMPDSHPFENSCIFPILEPEDWSVKTYLKHPKRENCTFDYAYQFLTRALDGSIYINATGMPIEFECYVSVISGALAPTANKITYSYLKPLPINKRFTVNADNFVIICTKSNETASSKELSYSESQEEEEVIFDRAFMGNKMKDIDDLILNPPSSDRRSVKFDMDTLSISILGFDSTSRSQFARHMPKTRVLMEEMGFITLLGYNKVGENSNPNLTPILAEPLAEAQDYDELDEFKDVNIKRILPAKKMIDADDIKFLWKKMEARGCESVFNDDVMHTSRGLYHYPVPTFKKGFEKHPPMHYYRPYYVHHYKKLNNDYKFCDDGQFLTDTFMYPWYLDVMNERKKCSFSFSFNTHLTHDKEYNLEWADDYVYMRLKAIKDSGVLENTVLIVMGDHGQRVSIIRYALAGKLESRLPLMSIRLPNGFREKYPQAYNNLLANRHRFTSNMDVHEMLVDLIDNRLEKERPKGRGISLFTPIPTERSCMDAHVATIFCTCLVNATENQKREVSYSYKKDGHLTAVVYSLYPFACVDLRSLDCMEPHSVMQPTLPVRLDIRDKLEGYLEKLSKNQTSQGFFTESRCTVRTARGSTLRLLARTRSDERGDMHSVSYPPLVVETDGRCKFKNLDRVCHCESNY